MQQDSLLPEDDPIVALEIFEGPLDLLLHLIKVNEVNILDLPMELITHQYLTTLRAMGKMELPLAGEYFVMAADLLKIKSQMLLPRGGRMAGTPLNGAELPPGETGSDNPYGAQGPDPRAELIRQLLDYQKLKANAALLEAKIDTQALSYPCLRSSAPAERPLKAFDRFAIMGSYAVLMQRLMERVAIGEITLDTFTVSQAIEKILQALESTPTLSFSALLNMNGESFFLPTLTPENSFVDTSRETSENSSKDNLPARNLGWIAAMFIGILELTRLGEISLTQDEKFGDILMQRKAVAV